MIKVDSINLLDSLLRISGACLSCTHLHLFLSDSGEPREIGPCDSPHPPSAFLSFFFFLFASEITDGCIKNSHAAHHVSKFSLCSVNVLLMDRLIGASASVLCRNLRHARCLRCSERLVRLRRKRIYFGVRDQPPGEMDNADIFSCWFLDLTV